MNTQRYFLELSYYGAAYSGFQVQENANSVQEEVEKAIKVLQKKEVTLTGSSRTDTGVHALQNYFHFDYEGEINKHFLYKLNAILPRDIVLQKLSAVNGDAHCRFDVPTAIRTCRALEEAGNIDWFEEPVPPESFNALKQVREKVSAAISWGERGHTKWDFVPILENKLSDYIMPDVTWTGGITELKKIATMAEAYYIPITPHDASGPINIMAGAHVSLTVPNFYRLEHNVANVPWYDRCLDRPLDLRGEQLHLSQRPGLGVELDPAFLQGHRARGWPG